MIAGRQTQVVCHGCRLPAQPSSFVSRHSIQPCYRRSCEWPTQNSREEDAVVRASTLLALFAAMTLISGVSGAASAQGTPTSAAPIPENLEPPADSVQLFALQARGV